MTPGSGRIGQSTNKYFRAPYQTVDLAEDFVTVSSIFVYQNAVSNQLVFNSSLA